jgi:carboxymethylenebutenolidase
MNRDQMVELWEQHTEYEFALRDANLAVSTMVDDAIVMHIPTTSGGFGEEESLRHYHADVFIPGIPADTAIGRSPGRSVKASSSTSSFCGRPMTKTSRSCC